MKFRKYLCLLFVFLFAFGIAACGKKESTEQPATTDYPEDELIDYEDGGEYSDGYSDEYSDEYANTDYYEYYGETESLTDGIDTGYVWNEGDDETYATTTVLMTVPLSTTKFDLSALVSTTKKGGAKAKTTTASQSEMDKTTAKSSGKATTKAPAPTKAEGTATTSAKSNEDRTTTTRNNQRSTRANRATTSVVTVPSTLRGSTGTGEVVLTRPTGNSTTKPTTEPTTTTTTTTEKAKTVHVLINVQNAVKYGKTDLPKNGILLDTEVEVKEGDTARDVLDKAAAAAGIEVKGADNYVKSIGGLREFDCGSSSGWLYSVNGEFPNMGANKYKLDPGDELVWIYTVKQGDTGYKG